MSSSPGSTNGAPVGVLICDDVDAMRALLSVVVQSHPGLRVVGEACDGDEAVAAAARLQPDVVLLDLSMPRRTGLDALPEIIEVAPDARVIVLSGFTATTIGSHVLELGAARFIEKGAHPDEILAAIEAVAGRPTAVPVRV